MNKTRLAAAFVGGLALLGPPALAQQLAPMGAYRGAGDTGVKGLLATEAWLGRPLPRALDFLYFTRWGDGSTAQTPVSLGGWAIGQWGKQSRKMTFGVPMTIQGTPLAEVASGAHDDAYLYLAKTLVAKGMADAILRIGWEFNGGWYAWAAAPKPADWIAAFQRIVTVMRTAPGQAFRIDWNPAAGYLGLPAEKVWPGDAYVDIVGLDVYCQWWDARDQNDPARRWNTLLTQDHGLQWHRAFAAAHGKPMSFPEWGVGTRPDGHGCGDDPYFVQQMLAWISANNVAYHNLWDYPASDYSARLSDNSKPLAGAALLQGYLANGQAPERPLTTPADPDMLELAAARAQLLAIASARDALAAARSGMGTAQAALDAAIAAAPSSQ